MMAQQLQDTAKSNSKVSFGIIDWAPAEEDEVLDNVARHL